MASYVEMSINDMDPALRAMVAYEPNDALDLVDPQRYYRRAHRETPAIRWEGGVALFRFDDILEAGRNPAIVSTNPATGCPFGMGSRRDLVVADPSLLPAAIEELMRFESPVLAGGGRWATHDTVVNGIPIKADEMVVLVWAADNHDEAAFSAPEVVELARGANKHMAFAVGLHRCLGSHLARLELRASIGALHERIPDYRITPGETPQYHSAGVRAATYLPLTFTPGSTRAGTRAASQEHS